MAKQAKKRYKTDQSNKKIIFLHFFILQTFLYKNMKRHDELYMQTSFISKVYNLATYEKVSYTKRQRFHTY